MPGSDLKDHLILENALVIEIFERSSSILGMTLSLRTNSLLCNGEIDNDPVMIMCWDTLCASVAEQVTEGG